MAKRRNYQRDDELGDPLGDVSQGFNIIQFLAADNDFSIPIDEPGDPGRMNNNQMRQHQNVVPDPQHNAAMFHQVPMNNGPLPESPPITDISGNGSSASPSSSSEQPYSPDTFNSYSVLNAPQNNNHDLILGVHGLPQNLLQQEFMPMHPQQRVNVNVNVGNQLNSPQGGQCFMSPYAPSQQPTPQSMAQVSPPPGVRNENYVMHPNIQHAQHNQHAQQQHYNGNQMDNLYNILNVSNEGSLNSQSSEAPINRKRARPDSNEPRFMQGMGAGSNPMASSPIDGAYPEDQYSHQVIKFTKFQEEQWRPLFDANGRELKQLQVHVVADKGFNYSPNDNCFVNQKKNHFQISVHVEACDNMPPKKVRHNGVLVPIKDFKLAFCGVKAELPTSDITIKQSRTDRKPHPHNPVLFEIPERRMTKVTVPRLHFSETTLNNQRKNFRPNPDQKYFLLVVRLLATIPTNNATEESTILIQSYASEKVIVRATNPGSFEPQDADISWNRHGNTLVTNGPVSIGTDRSFAKLTVDGDIYTAGRVICPSDIRLKEGIIEKEARDALENLCKLRVVDYLYKPEIAEKWGLTEEQRKRTGLIAQELAAVLPDAVRDIGDYLTINESRVFYETVLATQELCRLTGDLDSKIDEKVEEISQRLARYARHKKMLGSMASNLNGDTQSQADTKSMLSYSRTSLASTVNTNNYKEKRKTRRSSRDRTEPLCSSKLTQGTIITLVVVMAACLIAMSALYVLDWHNRNFGYHHVYPTTQKEDPANIIISAENRNVPSSQPGIIPLTPHCYGACKTYCCAENMPKYDIDDDMDDDVATMTDNTKTIVQRSAELSTANVVGGWTVNSLGPGVKIFLPSFNVTIDERYCINRSCSKRRNMYNLYIPVSSHMPDAPLEIQFSVPRNRIINNCGYLSEFPHKACPLNRFSKKETSHYPTTEQILHNTFELSVGAFVQSAYRFRVAFTTEACFSNEEHLHGSFEEYNLIFYRTCGLPNTTEDHSPF